MSLVAILAVLLLLLAAGFSLIAWKISSTSGNGFLLCLCADAFSLLKFFILV